MRSMSSASMIPVLLLVFACACERSSTGTGAPVAPPNGATSASTPAADPAASADPAPRAGDVAKGRQLYVTNCGICHATDPTKPGTIGPELAGSTRELVVRRVLHGDYPAGYTPKRDTRNMIALPHLAPVVDDIAAYLATVPPAQ